MRNFTLFEKKPKVCEFIISRFFNDPKLQENSNPIITIVLHNFHACIMTRKLRGVTAK